jgi:hypothetical protein
MKKDNDSNSRDGKVKSWAEVLLVPIVLALVGLVGTFFITRYQIKSAEKIADAERSSGETQSRSEQQVKLLEIFAAKFTSENLKERESSFKLLRMADPEFADKISSAIVNDATENPKIQEQAKSVSEEVRSNRYFAIVATFPVREDAFRYSQGLKEQKVQYMPEVYLRNDNNHYIVTLGGNLPYQEANERVKYAKATIATDAYVRLGGDWGQNLLQ